eukprot:TRINITY_DN248_c0_g2_i12.p1 TRINITY_DN248_c0_g2~~TRINITY_DN248_c0_g2_i12.p1  ORF type:complete len:174 (-),score=35.93 TRINITY_DN248_c0_g2_i12:387-851(-)
MIRRPPRSTHCISSAASDVYKRQTLYALYPQNPKTPIVPNKRVKAKFKTEPLNSKFEGAGYTSISFVYNFGDQLGTWAILILLYALIHFVGKRITILYSTFVNTARSEFAKDYTDTYKYNSLIRILTVNYLSMSFCSLLDFSQVLFFIAVIVQS